MSTLRGLAESYTDSYDCTTFLTCDHHDTRREASQLAQVLAPLTGSCILQVMQRDALEIDREGLISLTIRDAL